MVRHSIVSKQEDGYIRLTTMRNKSSLILPLLLAVMSLLACNQEPFFPVEPKIEFVSISPSEVKSGVDSILITFRFQDGDGDLGAVDGQPNLQLIDSRVDQGLPLDRATNYYVLPDLTPEARNPSIQGEITIKMDFTVVLPPAAEQDVRFQIKLWDQAENLATPLDGTEGPIYTDFIKVVR